jgi:hypothetical protein
MEKALPDHPFKKQLMDCQICHSWNGLAAQRPHRTEDWVNGMKLMARPDGRASTTPTSRRWPNTSRRISAPMRS